MSDQAKRTAAILAKAANTLELDVTVDRVQAEDKPVESIYLYDGDVTYIIEISEDEDDLKVLYSVGEGVGQMANKIGTSENGNQAVLKLLRTRFQHRVDGHVQAAIRWWDRKTAGRDS